MRFTKMNGAGNDFIILNNLTEHMDPALFPSIARTLCHRRLSIGADGLMVVDTPLLGGDYRMLFYNSDGSEGEMCGNAVRCVGKYVYEHGIFHGETLTVETLGGVKNLELTIENGKVSSVTVDMGEPQLTSELPEHIVVDKQDYEFVGISVGNPHAVYFFEDIDSLDLEKIGPSFENHSRFPNRVNTEFVQVVDENHIRMRVWERGSGETLACGTGACAVTAACVLNGRTDRDVTVQLLGGELFIEWEKESGIVYMTGPAQTVFDGEIELPF